ncbi:MULTISPECIES: DNA methyltransferase [Bradyrhizobium]|uniref:DNA methyltransferase n=1 Tax=Bradyrhizobium TaxID=374 RepID=UPI0009A6A651
MLALHPTVKPVQMLADIMLDCTARGELVLDPFLGSGSSLIAAERVGGKLRAIERPRSDRTGWKAAATNAPMFAHPTEALISRFPL